MYACECGRGQRALALTWVCTGVDEGVCVPKGACVRMCAWGCEGVCTCGYVCEGVHVAGKVVSEALRCATFTVARAETLPSPWR